MSASRKDFVVIGEVVKPHGVKGEVRVLSYAESPSLFSGLDHVHLAAKAGRPVKYRVATARPHKNFVLLTLEGVDDRDRAETLRGAEVCVPASVLPEPDQGEIYLHQIMDLEVRLPDGRVLGRVRGVQAHGDSEVWSVLTPEGEEILLPAADEFILDLDLEGRGVTVEPPPGLLELYLGGKEKE